MPKKISAADASYFLGFDGGGTKTECVLADAEGHVVARAIRADLPIQCAAGYTRAWFSLSEAADAVLKHGKIIRGHIRGICAGLGGAGRSGVARRVTTFFERGYPNAQVRVTTDLEIGAGSGIRRRPRELFCWPGLDRLRSAATRAGEPRAPAGADLGSATKAARSISGGARCEAVALAEEHRGPATALSGRLFEFNQSRNWDQLGEQI